MSEISRCRLCGSSDLVPTLDLGEQYVSGFHDEIREDIPRARMALVQCPECELIQLSETPDQEALYGTYWYRSGTNPAMQYSLSQVIEVARTWAPPLDHGDVILDIACNDGTLLNMCTSLRFGKRLVRVGIDPSDVAREAAANQPENQFARQEYLFANEFFSEGAYRELMHDTPAKIITSVAMFYDLPDPVQFAEDVRACLSDDGVWVLQLSYTPLMLDQNAFDNICAEHLEYYTLKTIDYMATASGFKIVDVTLNDTNGGSCCVVLAKNHNNLRHVPLFVRKIGEYRFKSYMTLEETEGYNDDWRWVSFADEIERQKHVLLNWIDRWRSEGKTVYGYGASTKGNTLLQYYGIGPDRITAIAEKQPQKFGKLTAGSWIPIISEEELRAAKPDVVIVFPWHFKDTFLERESELRAAGTKFVFPLPKVEIVE